MGATNYMYEKIKEHLGHNIKIVKYGDENIAIECVECNEVIYSVDKYDI